MTTKAQVGAMSTKDPKDPAPKPADVPEGNKPVDVQPEQTERERLRPIDQA